MNRVSALAALVAAVALAGCQPGPRISEFTQEVPGGSRREGVYVGYHGSQRRLPGGFFYTPHVAVYRQSSAGIQNLHMAVDIHSRELAERRGIERLELVVYGHRSIAAEQTPAGSVPLQALHGHRREYTLSYVVPLAEADVRQLARAGGALKIHIENAWAWLELGPEQVDRIKMFEAAWLGRAGE
jgi:hypothetical protein